MNCQHLYRLFPNWTLLASLLAGLALPQMVYAGGWLSLRNDTPHVLLVADTSGPDARRGKTQRLYPGESIVDMHAGSGKRTIVVSDARAPDRVLLQSTIRPKDGTTLSLSIQTIPAQGAPSVRPGEVVRSGGAGALLRLVPVPADSLSTATGRR